jgi:hypothetical protein
MEGCAVIQKPGAAHRGRGTSARPEERCGLGAQDMLCISMMRARCATFLAIYESVALHAQGRQTPDAAATASRCRFRSALPSSLDRAAPAWRVPATPKLLLITASSDEIRGTRRSRFPNFQQITMPYLAARVPSDWQVSHVAEEAEDIDWTGQPDVVGVTFHTPSTYHAYGLAARFRSRGACVVMGGPHVTLLPGGGRPPCRRDLCGRSRKPLRGFLNGFVTGSCRRVFPMARKTSFTATISRFRSRWVTDLVCAASGASQICAAYCRAWSSGRAPLRGLPSTNSITR